MSEPEIVVGIGGAAGDGVAPAGNILVLSLARQGISAYNYNAYQSVIRGGHSWLRVRCSAKKPLNQGDQVHALIALNQDTLDRHLRELEAGAVAVYNGAKLEPSYEPPPGVQLCPLPVPELAPGAARLPVMQNTVAVGAVMRLMGLEITGFESVLESTFAKKPAVVKTNIEAAQAGFAYATEHFKALATGLQPTDRKLALVSGNHLLAMGAALAGCKFYVAYPMSPATHVLEWFAGHADQLGICVRQVEDEISVINMAIGAGHMGVRSMCATSGGGFALNVGGHRHGQHHGNTRRSDQRHAGRTLHRSPYQDGAGRPSSSTWGKPGGFPARHHRADQHVRLFRDTGDGVQCRGAISDSSHHPVRSPHERGERNSGSDVARCRLPDRAGRAHH